MSTCKYELSLTCVNVRVIWSRLCSHDSAACARYDVICSNKVDKHLRVYCCTPGELAVCYMELQKLWKHNALHTLPVLTLYYTLYYMRCLRCFEYRLTTVLRQSSRVCLSGALDPAVLDNSTVVRWPIWFLVVTYYIRPWRTFTGFISRSMINCTWTETCNNRAVRLLWTCDCAQQVITVFGLSNPASRFQRSE